VNALVLRRMSDKQEGKEINERGYATESVARRLVALTGAPSWPFMRGCKACLTIASFRQLH